MAITNSCFRWSSARATFPAHATGKTSWRLGAGYRTVPDASRITPNVAKPGTRAGHDISVEVSLDAGVPIDNLISKTHEVELERNGKTKAVIKLTTSKHDSEQRFHLQIRCRRQENNDAVLTHNGENGGFFQLILQPPDRPTNDEITPKELVFVLDTSGSMSGFPIEKAKESMSHAIDGLNPRDTFNLITFAGDTHDSISCACCAQPLKTCASPGIFWIGVAAEAEQK